MSLSNTILRATLPSGNHAVYEVQPQHLNLHCWGDTLNRVAIDLGHQLAHEHKGRWFKPGGWEEITDQRTVELLESATPA